MAANYKPKLYKKTTDILYDAYFKNELAHGECTACACGNIIAKNMGYEIITLGNGDKYWSKDDTLTSGYWAGVFYTPEKTFLSRQKQVVSVSDFKDEAKDQILSTGYNIGELSQIEFAFEAAKRGRSKEDYMFNGLVAVLEVLKNIHQVTEDEEVVTRFRKQYESNLVASR